MSYYRLNKTVLKQLMLASRPFLHSLFISENDNLTLTILNKASVKDQKTLCKVLYCICKGKIPVAKTQFRHLSKKHVNILEKHFDRLSTKFLFDTEERRRVLNLLAPCYKILLLKVFD